MPHDHRRNAALLLERLKQAAGKRRPLRRLTNALRLVNGPGDGLNGLVLEQYDRHFCAHVFDQDWLGRADLLKDFLEREFQPAYFIVKDRSRSAGATAGDIRARVMTDKSAGSQTVIEEHGLRFAVDLNDGLNTGLFLDMRCNRHELARTAGRKRVLNCFSYTCSFGVHAKAQGAAVVNVDIGKKALERGRENYHLNGLDVSEGEFARADAGMYLERAAKKGNRFGAVIIDPPSFARAGGAVFQIKKDLPALIAAAAAVLDPGGTLFVSTNSTGITYPLLEDISGKALKMRGRPIKSLKRVGADIDFPGTNTFKESHLAGLCLHI